MIEHPAAELFQEERVAFRLGEDALRDIVANALILEHRLDDHEAVRR